MSPASRMKYYKSASSHLFVNCAKRTFYCENSSSRSKSSRGGFDNYFRTGGKTPGARPIYYFFYLVKVFKIEEQLRSVVHV